MLGLLACLAASATLFTLAALADARWPDRLSRRGRHLAGLPEAPPTSAARKP